MNLLDELRAIVGPTNVLASAAARVAYDGDASQDHARPAAVVLPASADQVAAVLRLATAKGVPLVPRGAGTGLSGGAVAAAGGILLTLTRMNRILAIDPENRLAVVQPGVVNAEVTRAAAPYGLYYAPDPSSQTACTIGGNVAENSGGAHCVAHGVTTNHVRALAAALIPDGRLVRFGGAPGCSDAPGYDVVGLLVGSEGTLGVVTEVTVRLMRVPEAVATLLAVFDAVLPASRVVSQLLASGVVPVALELMDGLSARTVEAATHVGLPPGAGAALLIEVEALREALDEPGGALETASALCWAGGAYEVRVATDAATRAALWRARKAARGALGRLAPNCYVHDGVVPRSQIPRAMARIEEIAAAYRVPIATYLHAGDGNLHPNVLFDERVPGEAERAALAGAAILEVCVELGGALSGEHGIGLEKQRFLPWVLEPADLAAQQGVKRAFDAAGVLNPGKIFPSPGFCGEVRGLSRPPRGQRTEIERS